MRVAVISSLAGAALASPSPAAAQLPSAPGISETCGNPTVIHDGFLAARSVYFRLRTRPNPTDPRTTWICYRVKVGSAVDHAGRIDVRTASVTPGVPTTDANSRACATGSNNLVPGPHPLEDGAVGDVPFYLDSYASTGAVWLCMEAGSLKERLVLPLPGADLPVVAVTRDSDPWQPTPTLSPEPGLPSSSCYEGRHGPSTELVNTDHGQYHLFLFSAQPSATELHLCARLADLVGPRSAGAHLEVNADAGQVVRVQPSTDTSPCTVNVVTLSTPPISIKTTPAGQNPVSICVNGTRYAVITGPLPPLVRLTPDP
ncbi:MAG TPA: hypothetical protein VF712_02620 [Thermoleophilaceae bacterium]|jgi:hypothetical protein